MEEKRNYHEPCTCNQPGPQPTPCPVHKQSCKGSKGNCFCLPPKVVPVEVDGCPILFRKVEIPASVGDETTNPPEPGLYRNVLLYYEATGNTYLYSSDGMPTKLPPKGDKGDKGDQGPTGPTGPAGPEGPQGERGQQGIQGEQGPQGVQGIQGPAGADGADGVSPSATVTQTATGATITITDAQGTTTADIRNGQDGNVPIATTSVAGKVKPDGTTITVTADGTISSAAAYTLPPATTSTLGGVIVGNNLTVDANGTLDATNTTYTAGTNIQISAGNVISATDTTYSDFGGATSSAAGAAGLVPAPTTSDPDKFLKGDGTWGTISQYTPTVFYIDKSLPRYGNIPYVDDVHVYKDSALTETATLQELYDAIDAGGATLVNLGSGLALTYNFLYAFHSLHNGNPDSGGDYMYFAGDDGTVLRTTDQSGFSTNNPAILYVEVDGLYSVDVMRGATSRYDGYRGLVPTPASADRDKFLKGDGTWGTVTTNALLIKEWS